MTLTDHRGLASGASHPCVAPLADLNAAARSLPA
jgi:hypothetical protein